MPLPAPDFTTTNCKKQHATHVLSSEIGLWQKCQGRLRNAAQLPSATSFSLHWDPLRGGRRCAGVDASKTVEAGGRKDAGGATHCSRRRP
jgi:hypothetical protein